MSSQPAVSLQVRTLEEELGVLLFERRGPRISLTRVGQSLYQLAMPLVEGMDRLPDTFAERHHGVVAEVLRIGAGQTSASFLLPAYLREFRERFPETRVDIRTGTGKQRLAWLRDYELDVIVAATDIPPPDVAFYPVFGSDPVLITPLEHPLAGRDSIAMEETAAYPFVGHTSEHYVRQVAEVILRLHGGRARRRRRSRRMGRDHELRRGRDRYFIRSRSVSGRARPGVEDFFQGHHPAAAVRGNHPS